MDCCLIVIVSLFRRPDHNLQDIRIKLFPIKKRKVDSVKAPTTLPPKRKQRKAFLEAVA